MDEKDFLPAFKRFGTNFNEPQYSWIEDRVASLKDFYTASTKRLLNAMLVTKT